MPFLFSSATEIDAKMVVRWLTVTSSLELKARWRESLQRFLNAVIDNRFII